MLYLTSTIRSLLRGQGSKMILSPTPPDEIQIFAQTMASSGQAARMFLKPDNVLRQQLASRWQDTATAYPELSSDDDLVAKLVLDLLDELRANSPDELIGQYWLSFLSGRAIDVATRVYRRIGIRLYDVQCACIGSIGDVHNFFNNLDVDRDRHQNLLANLDRYAQAKIKHLGYMYLRTEFADLTIGRSNLGLITKYSSCIKDALAYCGVDRMTIERDLRLSKILIAYLHAENIAVNRLISTDNFEKFCRLYRTQYPQYDDLPVNIYSRVDIYDRLNKIGTAIRKFIQRVSSGAIHLDRPIVLKDDAPVRDRMIVIGSAIESPGTRSTDSIENSENRELIHKIIPTCDRWLSDESKNWKLRKKQMLYLRYNFHLVHQQIAPIFNVHFANIIKPIKDIHVQMAKSLIDEFRDGDNIIDNVYLLKTIFELLENNFSQMEISLSTNLEDRLVLESLIQAYKQYLEDLREEYHKFRSLLSPIKEHEYERQLARLAELSPEAYPELNRDLTLSSFLGSIAKIQSVLNKLWD
jgi:hypothetical protein